MTRIRSFICSSIRSNFRRPNIYSRLRYHERDKAAPYESYTVGWLCALTKTELVAATAMLDKREKHCNICIDDENFYTYCSINGYNIVVACLPPG